MFRSVHVKDWIFSCKSFSVRIIEVLYFLNCSSSQRGKESDSFSCTAYDGG